MNRVQLYYINNIYQCMNNIIASIVTDLFIAII